ncbi:MAG: hypothetical protein IJN09_04695, partial [Oscillospiraceae bacterium]|nr:hypothetical protein [Oscillospiraceae bacterium]
MNEIINIKINGNTLTKDYSTAGVAGDANNMKLRIEFAENWDGFAKTIRFWNANGEDAVDIILGVNLLEDILTSSRVYITPIPGEAMTEAGTCTFSVRGYKDGVLKCSVDGELNVMPSMRTSDVNEPADVTPTQAEQLQAEIEGILPDITAIMQEAKAAEENAETSAENAATSEVSAKNAAEEAKKYANDSEANLSGALGAAKRAETAAESAESSANEAKETGEKAADELQKMIDVFKLTGGGNGVPVISVHDELYAEIVPEEGQVYVVMFDNVEASDNHVAPDENGDYPVVVTDTVRYRVKIGDGKTKLEDLPIGSSNLQAGDGNGSVVQIDPTYDNGDDCYCAPSIATGQLSA